MLASSLIYVKEQLELFLNELFDIRESSVILNHLAEPDGSHILDNQNKVVITQINICQETNKQYYGNYQYKQGHLFTCQPNQLFNVDLLFTSFFQNYEESLKFLHATMTFFQIHPSLTRPSSKEIKGNHKEGTQLLFEVYNIDLKETYSLWNSMGAKYAPSIIYKMRHITVNGEETIQQLTKADSVELTIDQKNP